MLFLISEVIVPVTFSAVIVTVGAVASTWIPFNSNMLSWPFNEVKVNSFPAKSFIVKLLA